MKNSNRLPPWAVILVFFVYKYSSSCAASIKETRHVRILLCPLLVTTTVKSVVVVIDIPVIQPSACYSSKAIDSQLTSICVEAIYTIVYRRTTN
jgi:hypothetical protein